MSKSLLITYPYSLGATGGGPADCFHTARTLALAGAQVDLLTVDVLPTGQYLRSCAPESALLTSRESELRAAGVELHRVAPHPLHTLADALRVRRCVKRLLVRRKFDAILGYFHESALLPALVQPRGILFGMIAAASYRWFVDAPNLGAMYLLRETPRRSLPRFCRSLVYRAAVHNPVTRRYRKLKRHWWLDAPLQKADLVIARSRSTRTELSELFGISPKRVTVCYCGVDPAFSAIERRREPAITRLLFFGNFSRAKGLPDAIAALGIVAARGQRDWTLKIAGSGDTAAIEALARRHGISDRIHFLGELDRPGLSRSLAWAQLALLPTHAESFGLAIVEAQAAGIPVIAGDVGAVPEVLNGGGWLVPPASPEQLALAILEALANPQWCFERGLAGRRRVGQCFSWQQSAHGLLEHLARAAADSRNSLSGSQRSFSLSPGGASRALNSIQPTSRT